VFSSPKTFLKIEEFLRIKKFRERSYSDLLSVRNTAPPPSGKHSICYVFSPSTESWTDLSTPCVFLSFYRVLVRSDYSLCFPLLQKSCGEELTPCVFRCQKSYGEELTPCVFLSQNFFENRRVLQNKKVLGEELFGSALQQKTQHLLPAENTASPPSRKHSISSQQKTQHLLPVENTASTPIRKHSICLPSENTASVSHQKTQHLFPVENTASPPSRKHSICLPAENTASPPSRKHSIASQQKTQHLSPSRKHSIYSLSENTASDYRSVVREETGRIETFFSRRLFP
jgi:hypothetical protein